MRSWLYYILKEDGRSGQVVNGVVSYTGQPKPLPNTPTGWQEVLLAWERSIDRHGLVTNFSLPLGFVLHGAHIVRDALYKETTEAKLLLLIQRLTLITTLTTYNWFYKYFFRGELDLTQSEDKQDMIDVPIMEGGLTKLLKANWETVFEFPMNDPGCVMLKADGIEFDVKGIFFNPDLEVPHSDAGNALLAISFINAEGTAGIDVAFFTQSYEILGTGAIPSLASSTNYFFKTLSARTVRVFGEIIFEVIQDANPNPTYSFGFIDNAGTVHYSIPYTQYLGRTTIAFDFNAILPADGKLFLYSKQPDITGNAINYYDSKIYVELSYRADPTYFPCYPRSVLYRKIIKRITGNEADAISQLCHDNNDLLLTCGDAIRNIPDATLKTSLKDFFDDNDATFMAGLAVTPNGIEIEERERYYDATEYNVLITASTNTGVFNKSANTLAYEIITGFTIEADDIIIITGGANGGRYTVGTIIATVDGFLITFSNGEVKFDESGASITIEKIEVVEVDLGEVVDFVKKPATDLKCNTFKFGHLKQDIEDVNGKYDPNGSNLYTGPITKDVKEYNMVSPYKAGPYEIEILRINLDGKTTTDDNSDNDVFVIASLAQVLIIAMDVSFISSGNYLVFTNDLFVAVGTKFRITGSVFNDGVYDVTNVIYESTTQTVYTNLTITVAEFVVPVTVEILSGAVHALNRPAYSTLEGVPSDTIFNLPYLTPKTMLFRHGRWIRSMNAGLDNKKIAFASGKDNKNTELKTVLAGVTVDEDKDELISGLGDYMFLPWYFIFKVPAMIDLPELLEDNPNRLFTFIDESGNVWRGFLRTAGIAPNDFTPQEFRLLASPNNDITKLIHG